MGPKVDGGNAKNVSSLKAQKTHKGELAMRRLILVVLIALSVLAVHEVADAKSPNACYTFTTLGVPFPGATSSQVNYISVNGKIVGLYTDSSGASHGYLDDKGVFTTLDVPFPGAIGTYLSAITTNNLIAGFWYDRVRGIHGFFDDKGAFTSFDPPGSTFTITY
jgi:hypothetical protein